MVSDWAMLGAMQMIWALRLSRAMRMLTASVISLPSKTPHPLRTTPTRADMIAPVHPSLCIIDAGVIGTNCKSGWGFRKAWTSIRLCEQPGKELFADEPCPDRDSAVAAHHSGSAGDWGAGFHAVYIAGGDCRVGGGAEGGRIFAGAAGG